MNDYRILYGDALTQLRTLPADSVHCVVTSPPYYGLRDYGADGQIGLEPTIEAYVARLVEVFEECRRVLRDDGTFWLNLGDSYAGSATSGFRPGSGRADGIVDDRNQRNRNGNGCPSGLKPKDLMMIPARVAMALQAAGWWLRADIIWAKRAPMPESVTDRPTRSHEHVFLLTKSDRYFYDAEAVKEGLSESTLADKRNGTGRHTQGINYSKYYDAESPDPEKADKPSWYRQKTFVNPQTGRNMRDVWHLSPEPYPDAHFATFPTEIPRRAILAGTSERGCCPACGAPWESVVSRKKHPTRDVEKQRAISAASPSRTDGKTEGPGGMLDVVVTTGWRPTCACPGLDGDAPWPDLAMHPDGEANWPAVPCTVLDPFLGSGTTIAVAVGLGRHGIGIELNQDYISLAEKRIRKTQRPLL